MLTPDISTMVSDQIMFPRACSFKSFCWIFWWLLLLTTAMNRLLNYDGIIETRNVLRYLEIHAPSSLCTDYFCNTHLSIDSLCNPEIIRRNFKFNIVCMKSYPKFCLTRELLGGVKTLTEWILFTVLMLRMVRVWGEGYSELYCKWWGGHWGAGGLYSSFPYGQVAPIFCLLRAMACLFLLSFWLDW